jgi:protein kinase D
MHCFELRTANVDYFVGEDPLFVSQGAAAFTLPPPESGVGAHLACSWETAVRQALMPVTSQPSQSSSGKCILS